MRPINTIYVHCAATRPSMDVGVDEIRKWHKARGFSDIGYHYVIRRNGRREAGRPLDKVGAHVQGHNTGSVGVCLVGGVNQDDFTKAEDNFTKHQWIELKILLKELTGNIKSIKKIKGHRDVDPGKACPSFDVKTWLIANGFAQYA